MVTKAPNKPKAIQIRKIPEEIQEHKLIEILTPFMLDLGINAARPLNPIEVKSCPTTIKGYYDGIEPCFRNGSGECAIHSRYEDECPGAIRLITKSNRTVFICGEMSEDKYVVVVYRELKEEIIKLINEVTIK
jgi:hypothetical protein